MLSSQSLAPRRFSLFRKENTQNISTSKILDPPLNFQSNSQKPISTLKKRKPIFDGYNPNKNSIKSKPDLLDLSVFPDQNTQSHHHLTQKSPTNIFAMKNHNKKGKIEGIMNPLELANLVHSIRINQYRGASKFRC